MITILFAENNADFLETRQEYLHQEGYHVIPALNSTEARRLLERGGVDLAIIDVRLENDEDEEDVSGLLLAKEVAQSVPKIILTGHPDYRAVIEALGPKLKDLPSALDYVAKNDGPEAMLRAVRKALDFGRAWLRKTTDDIAHRLTEDYHDARRQAQMNYWASLVVALLGIVVIFAGVTLTLSGDVAIGVASGIGGIITEAVSYLFFKRVDLANERMDKYHAESLHTMEFENLLASSEAIMAAEIRETAKEKIIDTARLYWLGSRENKSQTPTA